MNQSILEKEKTVSKNKQRKNGLSQLKRRFLLIFTGLVIIVTSSSFKTGTCSDSIVIKPNTQREIKNSNTWLALRPLTGASDAVVNVTATGQIISKLWVENLNITGNMATKSRALKVSQTGIPCVATDDNVHCNTNGCASLVMPAYAELTNNSQFPDPFTFLNGTPVTTKAEWRCRQNEIAALAEEFEYGYKPCTPYDATTATLSENILTVTVTGNGKTISFNCTITYPKNGTAPYPAMIGIGYSFLNNTQLAEWGVAVINFPNNELGQQTDASSRGKGKFYDFFCPEHSAGALMAWSWGVSRLIDALEKTPDANIDTHHLGVTGCSRNGKGALCAGAFDDRIALTIPQESGSGGSASWRVSDFQGSSVQCLNQIVTENCWFRKNFSQFSSTANKLPFDHHMIAGLCAPRGLLIIENTSMTWLGNISTWTTGNAAHKIWEALGVPDHMGYSQFGHPDHCRLPSAQEPDVEAFVKRFLLGDETQNTNILKTDSGFVFDEERWINWAVPTLQ